jgi:hypothetical protein
MPSTARPYSSAVCTRCECRCTVPLGVPVEPLEYSQKHGSSSQVSCTRRSAEPAATIPATESGPSPPATTTALSEGTLPTMPSKVGSSGLGDEQHLRARVAQHEFEILRGEQRVGRDRHDAGQDAAEEHHRPLGRVQHRQQHARLGLDAAGAQGVGEAVRLLGKLAVGEGAARRRIEERHLAGATGIAFQQVMGRVVVARDVDPWRAGAVVGLAQSHARLLVLGSLSLRARPAIQSCRSHRTGCRVEPGMTGRQAAVFSVASACVSHWRHHTVPSSSGMVPALASWHQTSPMRCAPRPCRRSSNFLPPKQKVCR